MIFPPSLLRLRIVKPGRKRTVQFHGHRPFQQHILELKLVGAARDIDAQKIGDLHGNGIFQ